MRFNGWRLLAGATILALTQAAVGQRAANWRVYKIRDGLSDLTCLTVTVSPQGKVLTKHLSLPSLTELDGYNLIKRATPAGNNPVYESPGGQLWTLASNGLLEMKGDLWVPHSIPDLRASLNVRPNDPPPLYPVRQGVVLCLLPDRLLEFNSTLTNQNQTTVLRMASQTKLGTFSSMIAGKDGGLWISGASGLARVPPPLRSLRPETVWEQDIPPASLQVRNLRMPHEDQTRGVALIAESTTNNQNLILYFDGNAWTAHQSPDSRIRHAWRGPDGTWWAASMSALFHSENEQADLLETEEISARQYFDVAVEPNGPFWIATSDGLFRFAPLSWQNPGLGQTNAAVIYCLTGDLQDRLWFASAGRLHLLQKERQESFPFANTAAQELVSPRSLYALKDGSLILGGEEKVIQFHPGSGRFSPVSNRQKGSRMQLLGLLKDGKVCLQSWPDSAESFGVLETYDGTTLQPLPCPAPDASLGDRFSTIFEAQNGDLWIGAERGTACYQKQHWKLFPTTDKSSPDSPVSFLEMPDGKVWCATSDKIWQFDGRDWSEVRRGFDRVNALLRSQRDGSVWVASNGGLHRFMQGTWIENGIEEGLPSISARGLYEDVRGRLWCGTTHGLSLYDPEADRDPPQTQLEPLTETERHFREGGAITCTFSGQDKWKLTPRERLLFSHRLDKQEWSVFQDVRQAVLTDLPAGTHSFQVRTMDRNGNMDPQPAQLDFSVVLPWYKETRLIFISLAGLVLVLFFAGVAFNRHHQLVRSYDEVEKKVDQRTRELEIAGRELLHSQKMNALGTLAAGVAHDFNNILSIIKGSAQIIEDNLDNPEKVRTRVDRIKTVVEQGTGIVKAMLGFSRESDQQPTTCSPNAVVEDTIKLLGDRFLREVQVSFEKDANIPLVNCPKDFVQQILINLIFNAAESTETQKQIILATGRMGTLPPGLVLAPSPAPAYVSISVQDFGSGIAPENMPRIFEPFFTTKSFSARRGTGLGLSMVYELAKKMAAGLRVESTVGHGSTFTLILPVAETK